MQARQSRRTPVAGAAFATAIALAVLVALGVWQLKRLAWKEGLLAQIDAAVATVQSEAPPDPAREDWTALSTRDLAEEG